jgi:hypothetical protein
MAGRGDDRLRSASTAVGSNANEPAFHSKQGSTKPASRSTGRSVRTTIMRRSSRRVSPEASAAWVTKRSAPRDRPSSSRAFSSPRVWAIFRTAWRGCRRLASRAPLRRIPDQSDVDNTGIDPATGRLGLMPAINGNIMGWGLALEYSTLYLTDRSPVAPHKKSRSTSSSCSSSLHSTRRSATASGARRLHGLSRTVVRGGDLAAGGRGSP